MKKFRWYAVRETWTDKSRTLKVLSRGLSSKEVARTWADYEAKIVKRTNPKHKFTVIQMDSGL